MPEIDKDLFQGLSLLLLLITVIALLALLATLSKATKLLKEQVDALKDLSTGIPATTSASTDDDLESSFLAPAEQDAELVPEDEPSPPYAEQPEPAASVTPSEEWGATPTETSPTGDESGADAFGGFTDTAGVESRSEPAGLEGDPVGSAHAVDPFTGEAESASVGTSALEPYSAQPAEASGGAEDPDPFGAAGTQSATGAADEQEEQPFERGGRWYFRRDGELLVYDETTGEWVDAEQDQPQQEEPPPPSWEDDAYTGSEAAFTGGGSDETDTETFASLSESEEESSSDQASAGGFWKCSSCGAVNGSTASTCRMCFAARP